MHGPVVVVVVLMLRLVRSSRLLLEHLLDLRLDGRPGLVETLLSLEFPELLNLAVATRRDVRPKLINKIAFCCVLALSKCRYLFLMEIFRFGVLF